MRSCINEEPMYFETKTCHVKANAFTIETMGVYVLPRVPASHRQVLSQQACESTGGVRADRCADSPGGEPFDQAPPPTFVPTAPTFNVAGAAVSNQPRTTRYRYNPLSSSPILLSSTSN